MFTFSPGIAGIIFDCDGTLADTMPLHLRAWKQAMAELGGTISDEEFWGFAGVPTKTIIELLNAKHGRNVDPDHGTHHKEVLYAQLLHEVRPIAEVVDVAHAYRGKLPMAVATGGQMHVVKQTLERIGLADHFDTIVSADCVTKGKPAPDIFLEAARRIAVAPARCVVFEDADNGIIGTEAAGMEYIDIRKYPLASIA